MNKVTAKLIQQNDIQWMIVLENEAIFTATPSIWFADIVEQLEQNGVELLIIELTGVESIDSQGLKFLLDVHRDLSGRDIKVILQNPGPHLRRLLRVMQFDRIFTIESTDPG